MILLIAISVSSFAFRQTKMPQNSKPEAQIIAIEKADRHHVTKICFNGTG